MRWAVHVARIGAKRNKILVGKPEGKRQISGKARRKETTGKTKT
jgi:hypothetical protein